MAQGVTNPSTVVTVSFILKARSLIALENKVSSGWKGAYLTSPQFAATYGQTPTVISDLTSYLGAFGITSNVLSDNLDVVSTGTAGEFNQALSIGLGDFTIPASNGHGLQHIYAAKSDPKLPAYVANSILSILGLTNYAPFVSHAVRAVSSSSATPAASGIIPTGELTPADFSNRYGLSTVQQTDAEGQGETIGIVTLASVNPGTPQTFWSSYLHLPTNPNRVTTTNVDGGAGAPGLIAGSDETDLDVEQSGAIADQAQVLVYEAPNTDNGFVDSFFTAASANTVDTLSSSWGESETYIADAVANGAETATYAVTFDEAFLEMAAQGQSAFVSAGDSGSYDATGDEGTTNLSIDNPGDSPYVTSSGGTTLPGTQTYPVLSSKGAPTKATESVTIPVERAWSWNYLWPLYRTQPNPVSGLAFSSSYNAALGDVVGGGGGYSTIEPRPSYQAGVDGVSNYSDYEYLTPTVVTSEGGLPEPTLFSYLARPALSTGTQSTGRVEPDLAYNADPQTGYALYDPDFQSVYGTSVEQFGGTSYVAPQLNGSTAVIDSSLGHRVGFWNPTIYAAAQTPTSPFNSLNDNQVYGNKYFFQTSASGVTKVLQGAFTSDNLYYTGTPGTVYNPGTGLGVGNLDGIDQVFAKTAS